MTDSRRISHGPGIIYARARCWTAARQFRNTYLDEIQLNHINTSLAEKVLICQT